MEGKKKHAALGRRLQAEEQERRRQKLEPRNENPNHPRAKKVVVFATPSSS